MDAFTVLKSAVYLIVLVGVGYVIPLIHTKYKDSKVDKTILWIEKAIRVAENDTSLATGSDRKAWVLKFVASLPFMKRSPLSVEQIGMLIDSAVSAMNTANGKVKVTKIESPTKEVQ